MSKFLGSGRSGSLRRSRPHVDLAFPQASHGRILPMEEPGLIARLIRRR